MKEDNISQLGDYDAPFSEQYTHGSCYISLFKLKSFDQFGTMIDKFFFLIFTRNIWVRQHCTRNH